MRLNSCQIQIQILGSKSLSSLFHPVSLFCLVLFLISFLKNLFRSTVEWMVATRSIEWVLAPAFRFLHLHVHESSPIHLRFLALSLFIITSIRTRMRRLHLKFLRFYQNAKMSASRIREHETIVIVASNLNSYVTLYVTYQRWTKGQTFRKYLLTKNHPCKKTLRP